MDTIERIREVAELTGVDLSAATAPGTDTARINELLKERRASMGDAKAIAARAVKGTPEEFITGWEEAKEHMIAALADAGFDLYGAARDALFRRQDRIDDNAGWVALELLSKHVDKLARDLTKLNLDSVHTAEAAIAAGTPDHYTKANAILDQLEQIAGVPQLDRGTSPLWVIVSPPALPVARVTYDMKIADDHTDDERGLIGQAVIIRKAKDFQPQLLTSARLGWTITVATTADEVEERAARFGGAATVSHHGARRAVA